MRQMKTSDRGYFPLIYVNPHFQSIKDWIEVPIGDSEFQKLNISLNIRPLSFGLFRLHWVFEESGQHLMSMGLF